MSDGRRPPTPRRRLHGLALILLLAVGAHAFLADDQGAAPAIEPAANVIADASVAGAFAARRSDVQVRGEGVVSRLLADDTDGSRHQRFILTLAGGQTLLVAHNIDLAPRLAGLRAGDHVVFVGEYEWNAKGGVLHWTHRDPEGRHPGGWLQHHGQRYQ